MNPRKEEMRMSRTLTAIRFVLLVLCLQLPMMSVDCDAQTLLRLTVKRATKSRDQKKIVRKTTGEEDLPSTDGMVLMKTAGVDVFSFASEAMANKLKAKLQSYEKAGKWEGELSRKTTDRQGYAELNTTDGGYILVDLTNFGDEDGAKVVALKDLSIISQEPGAITAEYVAVLNVEELAGTEKKARDLRKRSSSMTAVRKGKTMTFKGRAYVDSAYARSGARFGLYPRLVLPDSNNKTVMTFTPEVLDGKLYYKNMLTRMGYDRRRDKLYKYNKSVRDSLYMEDRKEAFWSFEHTIYPFDTNKRYHCIGYEWFEDFNHVYHEGARIIWPGRWTEYNSFINWDDAKVNLDVDTVRYSISSKTDLSSKNDAFHIQFKVGSEELSDDSVTLKEYDRFIKLIDKYYSGTDGSQIIPLSLKAYSSPEGNESSNRSLAQRRAHSLKQLLLTRYPDRSRFGIPKSVESDIVSWREVADTLVARGLRGDEEASEIAKEIYAVVAKHRTLDAQGNAIKAYPWYGTYLLPQVLPAMRRCEFQYQAIVHKILSPDEIMEKYERLRPASKLNELYNYEHYHVMRQLADQQRWEELEREALVARSAGECAEQVVRHVLDTTVYHTPDFTKACEYLKELYRDSLMKEASKQGKTIDEIFTVGNIETVETEPYMRPYALASYYLVLSRLRRGKADINTLEDYFDFYNQGYEAEYKDFDLQPLGWWNDEAFVVLQAMACCQDEDYEKANKVLDEHLRSDPKYNKLRVFIRCLNGEYKDPEVIDTVANSSPMNAAAIFVAQEDPNYYRRALNVLSGSEKRDTWKDATIDTTDARVAYLQVICNYKLHVRPQDQAEDGPLPMSIVAYSEDPDGDGPTANLAAPLFEAFRRNPDLYKFFEHDGLFPSPFHVMVDYFWKRIQDGVSMSDIAKEYNQLKPLYQRN